MIRGPLIYSSRTNDLQMVSKAAGAYEGLNVKTDEFLSNHVDLARFDDRQNAGYRQIIKHITRLSSGPKPYGKWPGLGNPLAPS